MKTKLSVAFERPGITVGAIAKIAASHNAEISLLSLKDIMGAIKNSKSEYPHTLKDLVLELIKEEGKLNVYEDGKNLTYTVQENEYYTIEGVTDKDAHIAGEDALFLNPVYERNSNQ